MFLLVFSHFRITLRDHKSPKPLIQMVSDFYFFLTEKPSKTKSSGNRGFKTNLLLPELFCFLGKTWFFPVFLMNPLRWNNLIVLGKIWRFRGIIWFHLFVAVLVAVFIAAAAGNQGKCHDQSEDQCQNATFWITIAVAHFRILLFRLIHSIRSCSLSFSVRSSSSDTFLASISNSCCV